MLISRSSTFCPKFASARPNLYIKGPAHYVDLLRKEEPEKRLLKLTGAYYPSARNFVLSRVRPVRPGRAKRATLLNPGTKGLHDISEV